MKSQQRRSVAPYDLRHLNLLECVSICKLQNSHVGSPTAGAISGRVSDREDEEQGGNAASVEEHVCAFAGDAQVNASVTRVIARILRREMSLARAGGGNGTVWVHYSTYSTTDSRNW